MPTSLQPLPVYCQCLHMPDTAPKTLHTVDHLVFAALRFIDNESQVQGIEVTYLSPHS